MRIHFIASGDELLNFVRSRQLANGEKQEVDISTDKTGEHVICQCCGIANEEFIGYQTSATAKKIAIDILCRDCLVNDYDRDEHPDRRLNREFIATDHYTDENLNRFVPMSRYRQILREFIPFNLEEFETIEKALLARGADVENAKIDAFKKENSFRFSNNEIRLANRFSYHPTLLAKRVVDCLNKGEETYFTLAPFDAKMVMDLRVLDKHFGFSRHYLDYCNQVDSVKSFPEINNLDDLQNYVATVEYIPNHKILKLFNQLIQERKFELARDVLKFVQRAMPERNLSAAIWDSSQSYYTFELNDFLSILALANDELLDRFADRIKAVVLKSSDIFKINLLKDHYYPSVFKYSNFDHDSDFDVLRKCDSKHYKSLRDEKRTAFQNALEALKCEFTGLEFVRALCSAEHDQDKREFTLEFGERSFTVSTAELKEAAYVVQDELKKQF